VARLLAVFLAVALTPCLGGATEFSAVFETDADAGSGDEVVWQGYHSMNDFMLSNQYDYFYSEIDIASTYSMGGFACDEHQCQLLLESNADAGGGNEVYLVTYESLADFYTDTQVWGGFTAHDILSTFTTHGFASDGTRYYMVLESNADAGAGAEVYVMTYTSLANVISGTEESEAYSQININSDWSIADLAADGEKFYLVLESNADVANNEIYVITYASFADLMSNTQESAAYSSMNVSTGWSINGFAAGIPLFDDGFESGDTSAWSSVVP
jgi:hypothetical protein